jgi:Cytochrome P450
MQKMKSQIIGVLSSRDEAEKGTSHTTLFSALLKSNLPAEEITAIRLQHEAISVVGAGLETTKWALSVACFHLLDNPVALSRLREELFSAIPDVTNMPSLAEIQRLPYLSACIEECTYSNPTPTPRLQHITKQKTFFIAAIIFLTFRCIYSPSPCLWDLATWPSTLSYNTHTIRILRHSPQNGDQHVHLLHCTR